MTVEYLERIGAGFHHDVWLVRVDGALAQALVHHGSDREWEQEIEAGTRRWVRFTHERIVPLLACDHTGERLVIIHGDDRGPSIVKMAGLLADPNERRRWAAEQIASIAEAIALLGWRESGFVHRRVGPEQIVVGADGNARLRALVAFVTWGKLGSYVGRGNSLTKSVRYLAPEQVRGQADSPATDVHGLAGTLYTCLTGDPPFRSDSELGTLQAIIADAPLAQPKDVPRALADLIVRSLAVDPAARPHDPATFAAELRRCMPEPLSPTLLAKVTALRPDARTAPHQSELIVGSRCAKQWSDLTPTASDGVRHCARCQHDVVQVRSVQALIPLLGHRCVAFKPDDSGN